MKSGILILVRRIASQEFLREVRKIEVACTSIVGR